MALTIRLPFKARMDTFILIANPISGKGRAKTIAEQAYAALTESGQTGTLALTAGPGDAERFAQDAVNAGIRKIIACGGDGTLHEVVNGIAQHSENTPIPVAREPVPREGSDVPLTENIPDTVARGPVPREAAIKMRDTVARGPVPRESSDGTLTEKNRDTVARGPVPREATGKSQDTVARGPVPREAAVILGVLPCGRGNDFAAAIGVPRKPEEAIQNLFTGKPTQVDLGKITPLPVDEPSRAQTGTETPSPQKTRYFITIATCGYDAEVSRRGAERSTPFKGTAAYVCAALATLADYKCPIIKLEGDFGTVEGEHLLAATGITPRYGGGFRIVPNARYDDGLFDVCSIRPVSKITILRLLVTLFWGGHVSHPAVEMRQTRTLRIETEPAMLLYADGEPMCETPAMIEIVKHGLTVIAP